MVDNDVADSSSLSSTFVFDLFEDTIVAEFTGRNNFAEENFEIVRLLCLFYNAKLNYEAHPYDQIVRLPDGTTTTWEYVTVGTQLFSPNGIVTVTDIPMDGIDDIYKVTLNDGREIEASSNHIWLVNKLNEKDYKEVTTLEMFKSGVINKFGQSKYFIPNHNGVEYQYKEVPIDPYTLGLLIAEGAFTKFQRNKYKNHPRHFVQMSFNKTDAEFYKTVIPYTMKYIGTKGYSWHLYIDNIDKILESLGLLFADSSKKFIPELYLYNSREVRLELLKGIMDGDGCATNGANILVSTSKKLVDDVLLLCRSLGIRASFQKSRKEGVMYNRTYDKFYNTKKVYRIAIVSNIPIFKLPRKVNKQYIYKPFIPGSKASALLYKTPISKIEYIGKKRCKCVTVNNDNGLYLIGDYVITHNCNKKGLFAYFQKMHSTYLLAETPQYLRDKQLIKYSNYGSNAYGVNASAAINNYANGLLKDWFNKLTAVTVKNELGEEVQTLIPMLYTLKSRALIEEAIQFAPEKNVDRIRAMGMVMIYREEYRILYGENLNEGYEDSIRNDYLGEDQFFKNNYDNRFLIDSIKHSFN